MPLKDEDRDLIFSKIKKVLEKCAPPMVVSKNSETVYELIGNVAVPYGSKKVMVPGMYFSSALPRKNMISFYFFPMYYNENDYINLIPLSKKYLKGKTCFNFIKPEQVIEKELSALLKKGIEAWKKNGYLIN